MPIQAEFDRLRQSCSAQLEQFIAEARKTEFSMQQLSLPISLATSRQFTSQRNSEVVAFESYLLASLRLREFLEKHLYIIH